MTKDKRMKPAKKAEPAVSADTAAGRMRRLADALAALLDNPITVSMSPLWSCIENEEDRRCLSPAEAQQYSAEEEESQQSTSRRKELKTAFAAARLDLQEDEAVFLERTISCLPPTCVDAWTHMDRISVETRGKLRDLEGRLRFRAECGKNEKSADAASGRKTKQQRAVERGGFMSHTLARMPGLYAELRRLWKRYEKGCECQKRLAERVWADAKKTRAHKADEMTTLHEKITPRLIRDWAHKDWPPLQANRYGPRRKTNT